MLEYYTRFYCLQLKAVRCGAFKSISIIGPISIEIELPYLYDASRTSNLIKKN